MEGRGMRPEALSQIRIPDPNVLGSLFSISKLQGFCLVFCLLNGNEENDNGGGSGTHPIELA